MGSKQREALVAVKKLFDGRIMFQPAIRACHKQVNEALAEPVRNCEVGTAEEQYRRHEKFCEATRNGKRCTYAPRCVLCFAKWEQMPYGEGGSL